ncbi:zinc ABC transporter substrate-binding protein [Cnuibacter physcomitrellae]|uniref:metal ABC transporter solute-binding protein, Zn/Mn family n=1 Tax=Cnuibacter physcomitrellae TaxID=1619308 RepID=UPI002175C59C|nr:zinc ABC transporter substrate-binding protein [Cnuibacter physcomitrellae]MCS5497557.1 zinc ABC transporter substrate-binding protein [Cnuibacter physcomitrellae]
MIPNRARPRLRRSALALAAVLSAGAALAGCTSVPAATMTVGSGASATLSVVASTDVYGSLASAVGGDQVTVTSLIDSPTKDPHEFQASARDQLAVKDADLVIENGGGYDDFLPQMVDASGASPVEVSVAEVSGYPTEGLNEHLWYDVPTMERLVDELADRFSDLDPEDAPVFAANATSAKGQLAALAATEDELAESYRGQRFLATEPLALYMLDAIGLVDATPAGLQDAVERGAEVPPDEFLQAIELATNGTVDLVVHDTQTPTAQANALVENAKTAGTPTVALSETLPEGEDYFTWMKANLDRITEALAR